MRTYSLKARTIPLDDSWDVIVVGGGPAGCAAAAAAAREGADTLLIEATGALGGMGTSGLVPAWCPFTDGTKIITGGLAEKVLRECIAGMPHVPKDRVDWTPIDPERLKRIYDDLVTGEGATVLFNTLLVAVEVARAGVVDAIVVANKAGLTAYRAGVYIDCTGDADLAVWAGAGYEKGDPETGDLQPATHCFILSNVDVYGYEYCAEVKSNWGESVTDQIVQSGRFPAISDTHACNNLIGPGTVGFNAGHVRDVDNTDPISVSRALVQGRKLALAFQQALAEFFPQAFGNAFLAATGSLIGIRETRRILGDYTLTLDDYLARRSFPDEICRNAYPIDVHRAIGDGDSDAASGWYEVQYYEGSAFRYDKGESHGIPYRCLAPKGLRNVLVAGRSISTDRLVQGSTRVMPVCLAVGEAAGIAAAHAADSAAPDVHAIDVGLLRSRLREEGAYLPDL